MTKEELKQKAYEYAIKEIPFIECITQNDLEILVQQAYITGAEPREKQIEIDAKQIRALQKQNGELTDKVKELEEKLVNADYQLEGRDNEIRELKEQIEKMKCCYNCSKWNEGLLLCNDSTVRVTTYADYCCEDWEIKEK